MAKPSKPPWDEFTILDPYSTVQSYSKGDAQNKEMLDPTKIDLVIAIEVDAPSNPVSPTSEPYKQSLEECNTHSPKINSIYYYPTYKKKFGKISKPP